MTIAPVDPTIDAYLRDLRDTCATSTLVAYREVLYRADRQLPEGVAAACSDEIRDWINAGVRRPATRHQYRTIIGGYFAWATSPARGDEQLDYDPVRHGVPRVKVPAAQPRPVDTDVLVDILARCALWCRPWLWLAGGAGLRCCEIADLDREHITSATIWIHGKGGKERTVTTHPTVWAVVRDLPRGPVARTREGTRATRVHVRHRANKHLQRTLGHTDVTMHRLRHWYGTEAYEAAGQDIRVVQELLGHSSPSTTARYVAVRGRRKTSAVHGLPLPPLT